MVSGQAVSLVPGSLLSTQILRPHLRPAESETAGQRGGRDETQQSVFTQALQGASEAQSRYCSLIHSFTKCKWSTFYAQGSLHTQSLGKPEEEDISSMLLRCRNTCWEWMVVNSDEKSLSKWVSALQRLCGSQRDLRGCLLGRRPGVTKTYIHFIVIDWLSWWNTGQELNVLGLLEASVNIDWSSQLGSSGLLLCVSWDLGAWGSFQLETRSDEATGQHCHDRVVPHSLRSQCCILGYTPVGQLTGNGFKNDRARIRAERGTFCLIKGYSS